MRALGELSNFLLYITCTMMMVAELGTDLRGTAVYAFLFFHFSSSEANASSFSRSVNFDVTELSVGGSAEPTIEVTKCEKSVVSTWCGSHV